MRTLITLLFPFTLCAQPSPPDITFVVAQDSDTLRAMEEPVYATFYFTQVPRYGITPRAMGNKALLESRPVLADSSWKAFHIPGCQCESMVLMITAGTWTMEVHLPDDPYALQLRAMQRAHNETPEVLRFRPGSFNFEGEVAQPWNEEAAFDLKRLIRADQLAQHACRTPTAHDVLYTQDTILLDKSSYRKGDTVHARVSGVVRTDGNCDSAPLYGIRSLRPTTGLVVDPCTGPQMDCGLATVLWEDRHLELDLADRKPGLYALVVCGVGMAEFEITR